MAEEKENGTDAGTEQEKAEKKAKAFSDEQQATLTGIINEVFGRGYKKAEGDTESKVLPKITELTTTLQTLQEKIAAIEAGVKTPEKKEKVEKTEKGLPPEIDQVLRQQDELIKTLQTKLTETDQQIARSREFERTARVKDIVMREAKDLNFFDPEDVFSLVKEDLKLTDDNNVVIWSKESDAPRLNIERKPMTVTEHLKEVAAKKPHWVKASNVTPGTGSSEPDRQREAEKTNNSKLADISKMSDEEFDKYTAEIENKRFA